MMKKYILLAILFFSANLLSAQSRFGLKIFAYPNVSDVFYDLDPEQAEENLDQLFDDIEQPSISYTVGLGGRIELNEKVCLVLK